ARARLETSGADDRHRSEHHDPEGRLVRRQGSDRRGCTLPVPCVRRRLEDVHVQGAPDLFGRDGGRLVGAGIVRYAVADRGGEDLLGGGGGSNTLAIVALALAVLALLVAAAGLLGRSGRRELA